MSRRRLGSGVPCFDRALTLYILRDNIARADALITAAEHLIEELDRGIEEGDEDEDESDDSISRRRNHVAHLIEGTKMAVRAAICAGDELDKHGA
jgi:hypothetical protein